MVAVNGIFFSARSLTQDGKHWIKSVDVFENTDNLPDGEERPPHSFEVLINDDEEERPADADDQIARVLWNNKPSGIAIWGIGAESGEAINDDGETVTVPFCRVTRIPIYIAMSLTTVPDFVDQAKVKHELVTKGGAATARQGNDVVSHYLQSLAFNVPGVLDVPSFAIGTAPSPVASANIPIGPRQVATFSAINITIG